MIDSLKAQGQETWLAKEKEKLEKRRSPFWVGIRIRPTSNEIYDPPIGLYLAGKLPEGPYLSIVGTRKPTRYGLSFARQLSRQLAEIGFCVVSGMARESTPLLTKAPLRHRARLSPFSGAGSRVVYPPKTSACTSGSSNRVRWLPNTPSVANPTVIPFPSATVSWQAYRLALS